MAGFEVTLHGRIWVTPEGRIHGLFSSRPRRLMKRCNIYVSTRTRLTFTTSDVSVSSSWFPDHPPTNYDLRRRPWPGVRDGQQPKSLKEKDYGLT